MPDVVKDHSDELGSLEGIYPAGGVKGMDSWTLFIGKAEWVRCCRSPTCPKRRIAQGCLRR